MHLIDSVTVTKIQHAVLSALRNLTVPVANKRMAAAQGRAAPILLNALPRVEDHHVAYKLLAAIRMLVDGQGKNEKKKHFLVFLVLIKLKSFDCKRF